MDTTPPRSDDAELRALEAELDEALSASEALTASAGVVTRTRARAREYSRLAGALTALLGGLVVLGLWGLAALVFALDWFAEGDLRFATPVLTAGTIYGLGALVTGVAYYRERRWTPIPMGVFAVTFLPFFPLGTALGGYTLWVLATTGRDR